MPQFDYTTFTTQLFWVCLTFGLLYLAMARLALPRIGEILEDRQDRIDNDLDKAVELIENGIIASRQLKDMRGLTIGYQKLGVLNLI